MENLVKIGVCLYIFNSENKVLFGLRKSIHAGGTWCPPGGHLEYGETCEQAVIREVKEETGLCIEKNDIKFSGYTDDYFAESTKQYVTLHFICRKFRGKPKVCEPNKCAIWQWFSIDELPQNIMLPNINFLKKYSDLLK